MWRVVYLWCLAGLARAQIHATSWDVTTKQGAVRGYLSLTGDYYSFLGIPYATAPTGQHRFKGPVPPPTWDGVFESTRDNVFCPQLGIGEEDCLVINIAVPIEAQNERLPVLVYVHGGAFQTGNGPTSGLSVLSGQGLVTVSFNYRLGALGFLCLGTEEAPGNAGMKDQVAALRWVQDNIASFGGDPDAVTLYGTSAGGAAVELLMLSDSAKGLFHRAISESGSALVPWAVDYEPIRTAKNIASIIGFADVDDIKLLTEFYKKIHVNVLTEVSNSYLANLTDTTFGFVPCVEAPLEGAFLTESPMSILRSSKYQTVPYITGFSNTEGFFRIAQFYDQNWKAKMNAKFSDFLPADLVFSSEKEMINVAGTIKEAYFGERQVSEDTVQAYIDYFGDITFFYGILQSALLHARNSVHPVYLLEFAYDGGLNYKKKYFSSISGAGHADISAYLHRDEEAIANITINDSNTVKRMAWMWGSFAKHGDPTPISTPLVPVAWTPVAQDASHYLSVARNLTMRRSPYDDRVHFWDEIYQLYYRQMLPVQPNPENSFLSMMI